MVLALVGSRSRVNRVHVLDETKEIRERPRKRLVVRPIAAVVFRLIMKHELLGLPLSLVLCLGVTACGGDDEGGNEEIGDTGTDDSTDDATDDATESADSADTSTDSTEETTDTGPPPDADMDGIEDANDNCPDDANPNQLDFDSDGSGNVCDIMTFSGISGSLSSLAVADAGIGTCEIPIDFVANGGMVQVQLDDNAQLVKIELTEMTVDDILDKQCMILILNANVSIKDFSMANGGGAFPVSMPHDQASHDAGTASGMTNIPHPIIAMGTIEATTNGDPPMPSPLELMDANLPPMGVEITGAGAGMTLTWANDNFVVATSQFMVEMPVMLTIDLQIVGLNGQLTLTP
ncbi:thrombospondin type 3 repeat-containing protein [Nannocystaceae bacterium ST9]